MSKPDFSNAAKATSAIQNRLIDAMETLQGIAMRRNINGHGVYSDPSDVYRTLRAAHAMLDDALGTHRATTWPTNREYDEAE